jgi:hypothetical protein
MTNAPAHGEPGYCILTESGAKPLKWFGEVLNKCFKTFYGPE